MTFFQKLLLKSSTEFSGVIGTYMQNLGALLTFLSFWEFQVVSRVFMEFQGVPRSFKKFYGVSRIGK